MRRCAFCGGTPVNKEHIWLDWISRALPSDGHVRHIIESSGVGMDKDEPEPWIAPPYTAEVHCPCVVCNSGWMSRFEDQTKSVMLRLMLGQQTRLDPNTQAAIASWAFLRALVFNCRNDTLPRRAFRSFYEQRKPPLPAQVWCGKSVEPQFAFYDTRGLAVGVAAVQQNVINGYVTTFSVRNVALQVVWHEASNEPTFSSTDHESDPLEAIWPVREPFDWPPTLVLDRSGLVAVAQARAGVH